MAEYIEREAYLKRLEEILEPHSRRANSPGIQTYREGFQNAVVKAVHALRDAPAVEVVLCRDCGSYHDGICDTFRFGEVDDEIPPRLFLRQWVHRQRGYARGGGAVSTIRFWELFTLVCDYCGRQPVPEYSEAAAWEAPKPVFPPGPYKRFGRF